MYFGTCLIFATEKPVIYIIFHSFPDSPLNRGRISQLQLRHPLQKGSQQWLRPRWRKGQLRKVAWYLGLVYNMFIQPNHPQPYPFSDGLPKPAEKPRSCSVAVICQLRCLNLKPWMLRKWEKHWFALWKIWPLEQKKWHGDTWRDVDMVLGVDGCWWVLMVGQVVFFFLGGMFSWCAEDVSMRFYEAVFQLWWLWEGSGDYIFSRHGEMISFFVFLDMSEAYKPRPDFWGFFLHKKPSHFFGEKVSKEIDVYTPPKTKHDNGKRPVLVIWTDSHPINLHLQQKPFMPPSHCRCEQVTFFGKDVWWEKRHLEVGSWCRHTSMPSHCCNDKPRRVGPSGLIGVLICIFQTSGYKILGDHSL